MVTRKIWWELRNPARRMTPLGGDVGGFGRTTRQRPRSDLHGWRGEPRPSRRSAPAHSAGPAPGVVCLMTNDAESVIWNGAVGAAWARHAEHYDATLAPFGEAVMDRLELVADTRVVDIGCGTGATTVELARRVSPGWAVGVDLSSPMLAEAHRRASAGGMDNIAFHQVDVGADQIPDGPYDLAFSRLGVMFFDDPSAAFANIRRSLVPSGKLGFICFKGPFENPFIVAPLMAAGAHLQLPPPPSPGQPSPFSLADPQRTRSLLEAAGFDRIEIHDGPGEASLGGADDLAALAQRVLEQNPLSGPGLASADATVRSAAIAATADAIKPFVVGDRATLGAATWIVTAVNP